MIRVNAVLFFATLIDSLVCVVAAVVAQRRSRRLGHRLRRSCDAYYTLLETSSAMVGSLTAAFEFFLDHPSVETMAVARGLVEMNKRTLLEVAEFVATDAATWPRGPVGE